MAFSDLALVVTDEQHRFGVNQRSALSGKGETPHVLVMSATPIPRTLALIIYGDLDVSIIDELPPGRQKVDTFTVDESYRQRLYGFIRKLVGEGRQVFVVCPMVEENEESDLPLKSAVEHAQALQTSFPIQQALQKLSALLFLSSTANLSVLLSVFLFRQVLQQSLQLLLRAQTLQLTASTLL